MTTRLEHELTEAMRENTAGVGLGTDVVAAAARRHRRRTAIHRGFGTAGVIGLVGVVTSVIAINGPASTTDAERKPVPQVVADAPTVRLAAAASATAETTFRVGIVYTLAEENEPKRTIRFAGAYDPVHDRGYLNSDGGQEIRMFGDDHYMKRHDRWIKTPGGWLAEPISIAERSGHVLDLPANLEKLLDMLRSLGTVSYAGRSGDIDIYRYTYQVPGNKSQAAYPVTGEVRVKTNLIVKVSQQMPVTSPKPGSADGQPLTFRTVVTFSDFGIPVTVERPTV